MKVNLGKYPKISSRRVSVEIERFDTYSLDHTLAHIILPALLQLKATKHGIPHEFVADVGGADYDSQTVLISIKKPIMTVLKSPLNVGTMYWIK